MKLNREQKNEIREKIIEMLENVPEGKKVHLDKELLEQLLFEVIILDEEKNIKLKGPAWSGKFLRKIDLSEVDFEDVSFLITEQGVSCEFQDLLKVHKIINIDGHKRLDYIYMYGTDIKPDDIYSLNFYKLLFNEYYNSPRNLDKGVSVYNADYSYTNAKIDLMKLFEVKYFYVLYLKDVNLSGVDLSSTVLPNNKKFEIDFTLCDVSNTNLNFPKDVELHFWDSNLSNLDLSNRNTVDLWNLIPDDVGGDSKHDIFMGSNLSNTKLNIYFDFDLDKTIKKYGTFGKQQFFEIVENIKKYINENLVGCYINGKMLLPGDNVLDHILLNQKANGYNDHELDEQEKENLIDSVTASIEEQIRHMK